MKENTLIAAMRMREGKMAGPATEITVPRTLSVDLREVPRLGNAQPGDFLRLYVRGTVRSVENGHATIDINEVSQKDTEEKEIRVVTQESHAP